MSNNVKHTGKAVAVMIWFGEGRKRRLMLTKRLDVPTFKGWWAAVGGSVEPGEYIEEAAQRETREETGLYVTCNEFHLIECFTELGDEFKCFIFEVNLGLFYKSAIRNKEPDKHSDWQFFTPSQALRLPKLMPSLRKILLTKRQVRSKMKA